MTAEVQWWAGHVGGQTWRALLVDPGDPRLDGCTGIAITESCTVYIRNDFSVAALHEVLVHELVLHVVDMVSGAQHEMQYGTRGRSEKARSEYEERITRMRAPVLHRLLVDLGFQFPALPAVVEGK